MDLAQVNWTTVAVCLMVTTSVGFMANLVLWLLKGEMERIAKSFSENLALNLVTIRDRLDKAEEKIDSHDESISELKQDNAAIKVAVGISKAV